MDANDFKKKYFNEWEKILSLEKSIQDYFSYTIKYTYEQWLDPKVRTKKGEALRQSFKENLQSSIDMIKSSKGITGLAKSVVGTAYVVGGTFVTNTVGGLFVSKKNRSKTGDQNVYNDSLPDITNNLRYILDLYYQMMALDGFSIKKVWVEQDTGNGKVTSNELTKDDNKQTSVSKEVQGKDILNEVTGKEGLWVAFINNSEKQLQESLQEATKKVEKLEKVYNVKRNAVDEKIKKYEGGENIETLPNGDEIVTIDYVVLEKPQWFKKEYMVILAFVLIILFLISQKKEFIKSIFTK